MRKSRFSEAWIIGMIKEPEAELSTADVSLKHGLSQGTFYKFTPDNAALNHLPGKY